MNRTFVAGPATNDPANSLVTASGARPCRSAVVRRRPVSSRLDRLSKTEISSPPAPRAGGEVQLTRCFCGDERRDLTLLRPYDPVRVVVTWIIGATLPLAGKAGVALISDVHLAVGATHTARPEDWRRTHSRRRRRSGSRWLHRVAMSLMLRGHSDGSRQSEDGKTDKRGFGHSQLP